MAEFVIGLLLVAYIVSAIYNYRFFKSKLKEGHIYLFLGAPLFDASPYIFMPIVNWFATFEILKIKYNR